MLKEPEKFLIVLCVRSTKTGEPGGADTRFSPQRDDFKTRIVCDGGKPCVQSDGACLEKCILVKRLPRFLRVGSTGISV